MTTAQRLLRDYPWTITVVCVTTLLNCGLWWPSAFANELLTLMQFDRAAILSGEFWRLTTGNLVHWSTEHFLLDVAAFAVLGRLYEPALRNRKPPVDRGRSAFAGSMGLLLLATSAGVGLTVLTGSPEMQTYRGLSGIDSGLFAAALCVEAGVALRYSRNWFIVAPAAAVFVTKLVCEVVSGQLFFGTESLGDLGQPMPSVHVAGAVAALAVLARWPRLLAPPATRLRHATGH